MVVVILIEWLLNVLLMLNRNMTLHPSPHFMLLHVLISLLTRLRLKNFKTWLLHLRWFPRDYRAVVHEENWANCPFKRKLYSWYMVQLLCLQLRTYATKYFPCWNIFNTLHTVCFMHGLFIYEIKGICHRAYFFRIFILKFSAFDQFSKNIKW